MSIYTGGGGGGLDTRFDEIDTHSRDEQSEEIALKHDPTMFFSRSRADRTLRNRREQPELFGRQVIEREESFLQSLLTTTTMPATAKRASAAGIQCRDSITGAYQDPGMPRTDLAAGVNDFSSRRGRFI